MMRLSFTRYLAVFFLFALLAVLPALAQLPTGTVTGTVLDPNKAAVVGADVTITSQDTGTSYTTKTGPNGGYQFASLNFGLYRITVSQKDFKVATVSDIKLEASQEYSVPAIVLQIGTASETVTIEAGAEEIQTTNAEITTNVDTKQLTYLPILDRNPMNMLSLEAGVNQNGKTATVINGQRSSFTSVTIDGINVQDNFIRSNDLDFLPNLPILSQVSEFTVNAQNGNEAVAGGSSTISIVTPRGTNTWHGQGFDWYRSNKWAANQWFNNFNGVPQIGLNLNQWGGSAGGKILKNKLFVYAYYESYTLGQTQPIISTILTPTARAGSFQYNTDCNNSTIACPAGVSPNQLITVNLLTLENQNLGGPGSRSAGMGNLAPVFTIDPAIAALLTKVPTAGNSQQAGDGLNTTGFQFNARSDVKQPNTGVRLDYDLNSKNSLSATYSWNQQIVDRPDIDATFDTVPIVSNNDKVNFLSTAWRWNPTNTLTNELRFGLNFAPAVFNSTQVFGATIIDGTDFTNPNPNFFNQGRFTNTYNWSDNVTKSKGNHTISFGGYISHISAAPFNFAGTSEDLELGFSPDNQFALLSSDFPAPISSGILGNADNLLSTLGGFVGTTSKTFNVTSQTSGFVPGAPSQQNLILNNYALYAADSWRLRKNLVVNFGLRWEYSAPLNETNGLLLLPVIPPGQTAEQTLLSNATVNTVGGNTGRSAYNADWKNFAPNVGIAWDPFSTGKTVIRAGYSIHYVNDDLFTAILNAASGNAGLISTVENPDVVATVSGGNGLGAAAALPAPPFQLPLTFQDNFNNLGGAASNAGFAVANNLRTPYVQEWNLSIQRELGWHTTLTVSYQGNHATGLIRGIDVNQVLINQNGFLTDFKKARSNCFLSLAAGQGCNINYTGAGGVPLTVFPTLAADGLPGNGTVQQLIEQGQVGTLADIYHIDGFEATPGQFTPNDLIRGGDLLENYSSSKYEAGIVEIRRRFGNGLNIQASYAFSKTLDDSDGSQNNFSPLLDNAQPGLEIGRANFDITHAFKANFIYELPFGKGHRLAPSNGIVNRLISAWTVSSVFTLQSGSPFSFFSGYGTVNRSGRSGNETVDTSLTLDQIRNALSTSVNTSGSFAGEVLLINPTFVNANNGLGAGPDGLVCSPLVSGGFCNPQPGQVGNLERNAFNGPAYFNMDLAISKGIAITERVKLELKGQAFNVLNHPTFFVGDQNINSNTFGQINSTQSSPRVVQIGASVNF
jgi:hypothetical protein